MTLTSKYSPSSYVTSLSSSYISLEDWNLNKRHCEYLYRNPSFRTLVLLTRPKLGRHHSLVTLGIYRTRTRFPSRRVGRMFNTTAFSCRRVTGFSDSRGPSGAFLMTDRERHIKTIYESYIEKMNKKQVKLKKKFSS